MCISHFSATKEVTTARFFISFIKKKIAKIQKITNHYQYFNILQPHAYYAGQAEDKVLSNNNNNKI